MLLLPFAVEVRFTQPGISMLEWFYLFDDELASLHTPCSGERGPRADGAEPRARRLVHVRLRQRAAQPGLRPEDDVPAVLDVAAERGGVPAGAGRLPPLPRATPPHQAHALPQRRATADLQVSTVVQELGEKVLSVARTCRPSLSVSHFIITLRL